jgi:PAS domain S-box-containing protein
MLTELFVDVPIGLLCVDNRTGNFLDVNNEFCRITGHSRAEARNLYYLDVVAPEDRDRVADYHTRRMRGDPTLPRSYEMLILTKSGERRVVLFHANVLQFVDGIFCSLYDITSEKVMLEPLLHAQKVDSLAMLAGGLASEFNNLLAAIYGYVELALPRAARLPDVVETLEKIQGTVNKAISHVQSLQSFAHGATDALELVDIEKLLRNLVAVAQSMREGDLKILLEAEPELGHVRGDASHLEQALFNVLSNAIESLPDRKGTVLVQATRQSLEEGAEEALPQGEYICIRIEDTGGGIPLELRSRVFQPFFTTKDPHRHPGMGLAITYGLVRDHGGAISLNSELGKGTTVTVRLPRGKQPSDLVPAPVDRESLTPAQLGPILVIDDQEYVGELLREVLTAEGYRVLYESSGPAALARLEGGMSPAPSLIVVDVMMPELDGRDIIRRIRRRDQRTPILVTSGYATPRDEDSAWLGMTHGFIKKPFESSELLAKVRHVLGPRPKGSSGAPSGSEQEKPC